MIRKIGFVIVLIQQLLFADRVVLIEDFIASWWTSCDEVAERLEGILEDNPSKVILIANHSNVDIKSYEDDKLSTADSESRLAYYGHTYVPIVKKNGTGKSSNSISNSAIASEYLKTNYFDFEVNSVRVAGEENSCSTSVTVSSLADYPSGNVVLMAAIIENGIDYK